MFEKFEKNITRVYICRKTFCVEHMGNGLLRLYTFLVKQDKKEIAFIFNKSYCYKNDLNVFLLEKKDMATSIASRWPPKVLVASFLIWLSSEMSWFLRLHEAMKQTVPPCQNFVI